MDVGEHMVHVVFGRPPLEGKSSQKGCFDLSKNVQLFVSTVGARMTDPTDQNLGEREREGADNGVGSGATDEPGGGEEEEEESLEAPLRFFVWLELLVDRHVLLAFLCGFLFADDSEAFEHFFGGIGVKGSGS